MTIKSPKKLIEVALPLDDINTAAAREKSIRHGHPSTLHPWWARRPLAAARAVLFAQLVNDPGYERQLGRGVNKEKAQVERERLFDIIRDLVKWENTNNEEVLNRARAEILKSWRETCELNKNHPQAAELFNPDKLPAFHDPFAGGGSIPLEAQRLGLEAYASDLNPVAVLINKAMIEIPPKFAGRAPVGPIPANEKQGKLHQDWSGARGLAEDVRRYGYWMREEAFKCIGHLYPQVELPKEQGGGKATVIAWLWARTVKSPNPAFSHVEVPLVSTFWLSTKPGKETYIEPVIEGDSYRFTIKIGKPQNSEVVKNGTKLARGANFRCIMSDTPIEQKYIRGEFQAKRAGNRLMAIVAQSPHGRIYLSPTLEMEAIAQQVAPTWKPEQEMNQNSKDLISGRGYGFKYWYEVFTPRQLVALATFSDLVKESREKVKQDAMAHDWTGDGLGLDVGGIGVTAYADAVAVYLALASSKSSVFLNSTARWRSGEDKSAPAFGRQALPMVWDYAEVNPFAGAGGDFFGIVDGNANALEKFPEQFRKGGLAIQDDAARQNQSNGKVVSTDPPYYDNIGYADLSDFFYIWLRHSLKPIFPSLFATLAVPKAEELVAYPLPPWLQGSR